MGEVEWNGQSSASVDYCYNHDMAFHMASMTGLTPGEEVTYRVGSGGDWSEEFTFTPIDSSAQHFEWISVGDHGDSSEAMDVSEAIIADSKAQMVTIAGDISYADGEQTAWDDWFNFQQDSMTVIPWVTAVGNHENEPGYGFTPYEHRFDSDGQAESEIFWYSRDVPGVHMVFMSTEHDYQQGSTQYNWLEQDLSSVNREVTPFVIVYGHKPMYSSNSYHGSEVELRDALEDLYITQGVDLVIAGHDHFYERTWPVSGETVVLRRNTAKTQATDYVANDPFPAETHEDALDKLTIIGQDLQEQVDRSLKLSRTNTMTSTEFTVGSSDRASKILAFDSSGELSVTQELGTVKGNWAASTAYVVRDIVKDTNTNNIFWTRI